MKKFLIIFLIIVIAAVAGVFWFKLQPTSFETQEVLAKEGIVLEILAGQVTVKLGEQETILSAPASQEITKDAVLSASAGSQAQIIFPSGSLARLDESTTVSLADFVSDQARIDIKILLEAGNLWSRVQRLADKETTYEVQTSNTVAVVKGTSFNVSYKEGKTNLQVLSQSVEMKAIDPQTKQVLEGGQAKVEEGNEAEVDQAFLPTREKPLAPKILSDEEKEKPWLKNNLEKDKKIETEILGRTGGSVPNKDQIRQAIFPSVISLSEKTAAKEALVKQARVFNFLRQQKEEPGPMPGQPLISPPPRASLPPPLPSPNSSITPKPTLSPTKSPLPSLTPWPTIGTVAKLSIVSVSPSSVPGLYQYTKITIKGSGFTPQTKGNVGGFALQNVRLIDASTLEATVSSQIRPGDYDVVLTDGLQKAVLSNGFHVYPANEGAG
jgi:hypothetical protein